MKRLNPTQPSTPQGGDDSKARAEAAAWMVRLYSDERSPKLEAALRAWLKAHPRNASHFEEMTQVWDLGGQITGHGMPRLRLAAQKPHASRTWALAACVVFMVAVAGMLAWNRWLDSRYTTGLGEQRVVRLEDGSRITLNSNTKVQMELTNKLRRVRLRHGEALFEVARDPARPFLVTAGLHQVKALGTSFIVRYDVDRTAVTLVEGKIRVSEDPRVESTSIKAGQSASPAIDVSMPGERLIFRVQEPPKVDMRRIDSVTAWRRGEVLLDDTPLDEAIAEMNRYDSRQVTIDDPGLKSLHVSGVYRTGDSAGFARGVADLHGLSVTEDAAGIHIRR